MNEVVACSKHLSIRVDLIRFNTAPVVRNRREHKQTSQKEEKGDDEQQVKAGRMHRWILAPVETWKPASSSNLYVSMIDSWMEHVLARGGLEQVYMLGMRPGLD